MTDDFVPPEVAQQRMARLTELVERHALAKHEARVGRVEEVLVDGPSKRDPAMWSGRTRQNKLVHFAPDADVRVGATAEVTVSSSRAALAPSRPRARRRAPHGARAHSHPGHSCTWVSSSGVTHLALVGPTASGKSELALAAAHSLGDVEIVSIDSMQIYRGLDIGTAKPTVAEQAAVPHHMIDVAEPLDEWSVARFQLEARAAIADVAARGKRALLVGGTGLYVRAVIDPLTFPPEDRVVRAELEAEVATADGLRAAYDELERVDPVAASRMEPGNSRRVVRALEVIRITGRPFSSFGLGLGEFGAPVVAVRQAGVWLPRPTLVAPNRRAILRDAGRRGWSTRSRRSPRPGRCRAPPGRPSATRRCSTTSRAGSRRSTPRSRPPRPAPAGSPGASACGSAVTPGSPGWRHRDNPCTLLPTLLAIWGA